MGIVTLVRVLMWWVSRAMRREHVPWWVRKGPREWLKWKWIQLYCVSIELYYYNYGNLYIILYLYTVHPRTPWGSGHWFSTQSDTRIYRPHPRLLCIPGSASADSTNRVSHSTAGFSMETSPRVSRPEQFTLYCSVTTILEYSILLSGWNLTSLVLSPMFIFYWGH